MWQNNKIAWDPLQNQRNRECWISHDLWSNLGAILVWFFYDLIIKFEYFPCIDFRRHFLKYFIGILIENGAEMAPKIQSKSAKNLYFCFWASFGETLARFGTNLVPFWCPLDAFWVTFGALLVAFGIVFWYFHSLLKFFSFSISIVYLPNNILGVVIQYGKWSVQQGASFEMVSSHSLKIHDFRFRFSCFSTSIIYPPN